MDFNILDNILNSMNAPPSMSEEQKRRVKAQNEIQRKAEQMKRDNLSKFRKRVEQMVTDFVRKGNMPHLEFEPMDRIYRNIIYEVAEVAGLMACSFGIEEVDRYAVIYTKDAGPTEIERQVRSSGGLWNAEVAAKMEEEKARKVQFEKASEDDTNENSTNSKKRGRKKFTPQGTHYGEKYNNIVIAPQKTSTNNSYGEVPSHLKRDHRSIEQTMADIKAKRQRADHSQDISAESSISLNNTKPT